MMTNNHHWPTSIDQKLLWALEARWDAYRRALRPTDQAVFDRLCDHAQVQTAAGTAQNSQFIEHAALVSMLIEQQKQLDDLADRLDHLEADLNDE
jgi:hypothetical protein